MKLLGGADGGGRTHTTLRLPDFESSAILHIAAKNKVLLDVVPVLYMIVGVGVVGTGQDATEGTRFSLCKRNIELGVCSNADITST